MRTIYIILLNVLFISCQTTDTIHPSDIKALNKVDLEHFNNIQGSLIPFYSLKGRTKKMSIPNFMERDNIPGLRIVFVDKGKIAWSANFGYADLANKQPVKENTVFAGASLSKPITTIAVLNLVERGVLDLDEDVNDKLIGWKIPENKFTKNTKVTLRRLINHTSGLDRHIWSDYLTDEPIPTLEQMLKGEYPSKDPAPNFIYEPGKSKKYSNSGYEVIEKLIKDVTGKPFEDVIEQIIFRPCGMTNSSFSQPIPDKLMLTRAVGYANNLIAYPYKIFPYKAAGGIWTTPDDLAKFIIALLKDQIKGSNIMITAKMSQQVFGKGSDQEKLGFSIWNWKDDVVFRHTGHDFGFTSFILGSVNNEQAVIVMANSDNTNDLFDHIQRAVSEEYKWDYLRPESYNIFVQKKTNLKNFTGQYNWEGDFMIIINEYDKLFMQNISGRYQLIPIAEDEFLVPEISLKIIYPKDKDKEGKLLEIWKANGDYSEAKKIN